MAISFSRYISITSGVGGVPAASERELIMRAFTTNELLPTGTIREFDSADGVGTYFGTSSEEYVRATQYFGWISKQIPRPRKISFARWADQDTAPMVFGTTEDRLLATFTAISDGSIKMTLGGVENSMTAMNFSSELSLAGVASVIETAIQTKTGTMWTGATVSYDATNKRFNFEGGDVGAANIIIADAASGTAIKDLIGWGTGAILSDGADTQTISTLLADSTELSNNFGSFVFMPALTQAEIEEAASWNDTQNNMFIYSQRVESDTAASISAAVIGESGCGLTLDPEIANEYPDQIPCTVLAATDYSKPAAAKNYMFQQFPDLTASVDNNADADVYDLLRVNYIGQTQTAGQNLGFYQQGYLCGGLTDAIDMGVYANEIWLKDAAAVALINLLIAMDQVPANKAGKGMCLSVLQDVIDRAVTNGTIQPGKTLTTLQKTYITEIADDSGAWRQVESLGYWLDAVIETYTEDSITKYKCSYTLVYAKGDSVRMVEGRDIRI